MKVKGIATGFGISMLAVVPTHDAAPQLRGQLFHYFEAPNRFGMPAFYTLGRLGVEGQPAERSSTGTPRSRATPSTRGTNQRSGSSPGVTPGDRLPRRRQPSGFP